MHPTTRVIPTFGTCPKCYHGWAGYKPADAKYSAQVPGKTGLSRWNHSNHWMARPRGWPIAIPMYQQIAEDLRAQIGSAHLQSGQQLRTGLELRERYGASRNTVRGAIKWLTTLGLVEGCPGQGTFVLEKIDPFVATLAGDRLGPGGDNQNANRSEVSEPWRVPSVSPVQVEIQKASEETAAGLWIPKGHGSYQSTRTALQAHRQHRPRNRSVSGRYP
jgi:regulatory GntR family protein